MKVKKIYWFLLTVPALVYSCKKVINVNLNDAAPQIVIEGVVTDQAAPYSVNITRTVNFSATNTFPGVSGALVVITDSSMGLSDTLSESSAGQYLTHTIHGVPGHLYGLYVSTGGQTYTASSVMPEAVILDSVSFQHNNDFGNTQINAIPNFQDPPGAPNYYTFKEFVNGKQLKEIFAIDDRLSDGKYISFQLYTDSAYLQTGDAFTLEMNCVDKHVYEYFNSLEQAVGNNDQSATPANPTSNISNNALGYFSAGTLRKRNLVVY